MTDARGKVGPEDAPICPYCQQASVLVDGSAMYPHRPDLSDKWFYRCDPCKAWVGCHPNTKTPLGRLANAELRKAKSAAHAAFDPLWKRKTPRKGARSNGYAWLAQQLGIAPADCHIGMMDVDMCKRVVAVCQPYRSRP